MSTPTTLIPANTAGSGVPIKEPVEVASGDGAIASVAGGRVHITKATAAALTLAVPYADGCELTIISETAAAHTVTHTPGFGGGTTSRDVATFGGAISDNIVLVSRNGVWWVKSTRNVTIA